MRPMILLLSLLLCGVMASAETVRLRAQLVAANGKPMENNSGVVVWLTPVNHTVAPPAPKDATLTQVNKTFVPHLLVVPAGSLVHFPNQDLFFHNVFSLYNGKRFDLGLYEAGSSRAVRFDRPGVSYIFCNIHPEMSAAVVAMTTPYYAVSAADGSISIPNVEDGAYELNFWSESAPPEDLKKLSRTIQVNAGSADLGTFRIPATLLTTAHKNKFGQDYDVRHSKPY